MRRTAAAAGVLLVGLLALIALLVTRQVVSPVRLAARTAERLFTHRHTIRYRLERVKELMMVIIGYSIPPLMMSSASTDVMCGHG